MCVSYQADTSRIVHQSYTATCLAILIHKSEIKVHVMMYVPRSQCSHCIITECMLIDVCFVMHVMQEPQGEQCCALMGYSWVNMSYDII